MSSPSSDSARMEVVQCERDIQSIKAALRQVSSIDSNQPNSLKVIWTKIEGGGSENKLNADDVEISLQLSAPVEEATISKIQQDGEDNSVAVEDAAASFEGVETSMATLTVTLKTKEGGKILGTSEAYDMSPICSLGGDAMKPKEEYVSELPVAIVASPGEEAAFITTEDKKSTNKEEGEEETTKEDDDKKKEEVGENDKKKEEETTTTATEAETSAVVKPMATLTLKMVFKPSAKDQKEELYELLNKASLRRSQALERHRGESSSPTTTTTTVTTSGGATTTTTAKPAVKPGFLNKKSSPNKKKGAEPERKNKLIQFYEKYLGPQSLGRSVIFPTAKNYVIFFGAVILFHFKGQELALPAPV